MVSLGRVAPNSLIAALLPASVLLAGCSGTPTPTASEQSICHQVRASLDKFPPGTSIPAYEESEANHLLPTGTHGSRMTTNVIIFVRGDFDAELIHFHDTTFERVGRAFKYRGDPALVRRLDVRCSALRL